LSKTKWKEPILNKIDEEVFTQHKKHAEQTMRIVVALIAAMFLFTLIFLLQDEF